MKAPAWVGKATEVVGMSLVVGGVVGLLVAGIDGLASNDREYWTQIDDTCWLHESQVRHFWPPFTADHTKRITYCPTTLENR